MLATAFEYLTPRPRTCTPSSAEEDGFVLCALVEEGWPPRLQKANCWNYLADEIFMLFGNIAAAFFPFTDKFLSRCS